MDITKIQSAGCNITYIAQPGEHGPRVLWDKRSLIQPIKSYVTEHYGLSVWEAADVWLKQQANAADLAPYFNADPDMVVSIVETGKIRYLYGNKNIPTETRIYKGNKVQIKFYNERSSSDTGIYSSSPSSYNDGSRYFRLFFHGNNWYYDWFTDTSGRVSGGSAAANRWYEVEAGNRYIKDLSSGSYYLNSTAVTSEFGETCYNLDYGSSSYHSFKQYFKVYNSSDELVGHYIPCVHNGQGGYLNLVTGNFFTNDAGTFTAVIANA